MPVLPRSRRRLVNALLASVLAHGVLLVGVVQWWPVRLAQPSASVRAVVRGGLPEGAGSRSAASLMTSAATETPPRPAAPAAPETGRSFGRQPERASAGRSGAADGRRKAVTQEAPRVATASPTSEQTEGVDAADVRQYRFALAIAARRFRPASVGLERKRFGDVDVAIVVPRANMGPHAVLHRSSGDAGLDDDAVAMMTRAVAVAALPEGMRGRDFRIVMRLRFAPDEGAER